MLTNFTIPLTFIEEQGVDDVLYYVVYGDKTDDVVDIVAKCTKDGKASMYSFKARGEDIGESIEPYKRYLFVKALENIREYIRKQEFIKYLEEHPRERFFQALRNYCMTHINEDMKFIGYSNDSEHYKDTFYLEDNNGRVS